ncbi:hypothetical protein [Actinomyces naeslundii]|uniref:Uncharacterized protein n=1 Tax=Actinomyces naeslundii TaxID=1655 RepID=A0AA47INL9_ACTNA|nr:hypothetical protein [Actinomyces naeslundii]WAL42618.1 hypothetical protein OFA60_11320 [Actinomyces naeslundii]
MRTALHSRLTLTKQQTNAVRAHVMNSTAPEKKELAMPVGEELPMLMRQP